MVFTAEKLLLLEQTLQGLNITLAVDADLTAEKNRTEYRFDFSSTNEVFIIPSFQEFAVFRTADSLASHALLCSVRYGCTDLPTIIKTWEGSMPLPFTTTEFITDSLSALPPGRALNFTKGAMRDFSRESNPASPAQKRAGLLAGNFYSIDPIEVFYALAKPFLPHELSQLINADEALHHHMLVSAEMAHLAGPATSYSACRLKVVDQRTSRMPHQTSSLVTG